MLKEKLQNGQFVLGTWCEIPSPMSVNILAKSGLDFVIIDMEHGSVDYETSQNMIMAAQSENCTPIVRVSENNESCILRALDQGPGGIIIPHIENIQDRKKVINYSKFSPVGNRGFNPFIRSCNYHKADKDFLIQRNKESLICLMLEGKSSIENIEEIISCEEVDIVYIGTYDLSVSMGVPGEVKHKSVRDALEKSVDIIRKNNKIAGCMVHNMEDIEYFKQIGIQFITYKADSAILYSEFNRMAEELKTITSK